MIIYPAVTLGVLGSLTFTMFVVAVALAFAAAGAQDGRYDAFASPLFKWAVAFIIVGMVSLAFAAGTATPEGQPSQMVRLFK